MLADRYGLLHAWRADGSAAEMLPRAIVGGRVLATVKAVVGVAGGFVVAGHAGATRVAAHYDLAARTCTAHAWARPGCGPGPTSATSIRSWPAKGGQLLAIDLGATPTRMYPGQGGRPPGGRGLPLPRTARPSWSSSPRATRSRCGPRRLPPPGERDDRRPGGAGEWEQFTPLTDGRPKFQGGQIVRARWHGDVLAVVVGFPDGRRMLHAFSASDSWRSLGEFTLPRDVRDFALSRDGRRLAWRAGGRRLEVRDIESGARRCSSPPRGRCTTASTSNSAATSWRCRPVATPTWSAGIGAPWSSPGPRGPCTG